MFPVYNPAVNRISLRIFTWLIMMNKYSGSGCQWTQQESPSKSVNIFASVTRSDAIKKEKSGLKRWFGS